MKQLHIDFSMNDNGNWKVWIVEQTHVQDGFGEDGLYNFEYGELSLSSCSCIQNSLNSIGGGSFFVRGDDQRLDNHAVDITEVQLRNLIVAVNAYNQHFANNPYSRDIIYGGCKGTCGVIMCPDCMKLSRENITFYWTDKQFSPSRITPSSRTPSEEDEEWVREEPVPAPTYYDDDEEDEEEDVDYG